MKHQKGFTLIELLVVITILGVMAAIGLTSFKTANQKARNSRRAADIQQLRSALEMYKTDTGAYPLTAAGLTVLDSYTSGQRVKDPKNSAPYTYEYVSSNGSTYTLTYYTEPSASPVPLYNP